MSCAAGRATSRELPFRNAGNIPLRVRLKVSSDHPELFSVSPDFLLIEPKQVKKIKYIMPLALYVKFCITII